MSTNKIKNPLSLVDSMFRIRWEVTKEEFDHCEFPNSFDCPTFKIKVNGEQTECVLTMHAKGKDEESKNKVVIYIYLDIGNKGDGYHKVRLQFGIETQTGYWPNDFVKKFYSKDAHGDIASFGFLETFSSENRSWGYALCSTEDFRKHFVEDKGTIVASFVIYEEGELYRHHMAVTDNFVDDIRSMSSFDSLSDFTIVSGDTRFPCHRNLLAARSKYFEALFRNEPTKKVEEVGELPNVVEAMLEFITKGRIPGDIDDKAMDLMLASDNYGLDLLTVACQNSLVNSLSPENAIERLIKIDNLKHVLKVEHRLKILAYIKKEATEVVKTKDWKKFVTTYPDLFTEILLLKS